MPRTPFFVGTAALQDEGGRLGTVAAQSLNVGNLRLANDPRAIRSESFSTKFQRKKLATTGSS
jgi:hypothetical protein